MYQLYIEKHKQLIISEIDPKFEPDMKEIKIQTFVSDDQWFQYNANYIFANDRKTLKELARKIKNDWIIEISTTLADIAKIEI